MNLASVVGTEGVIANLTVALKVLDEEAMKVTEASANAIGDAADALVPVDTGDLKASKVVEAFEDNGVKGWQVSYGGDLPTTSKTYTYPEGDAQSYAWFCELGTIHRAATPFLLPAFESEKPNWQSNLNSL